MKNKTTYSKSNYKSKKYKDILSFVKSKSIPERQKIILEIQLEDYFNEYDKSEVVTNSV